MTAAQKPKFVWVCQSINPGKSRFEMLDAVVETSFRMGLLWENLSSQLDSIRSTANVAEPAIIPAGGDAPDASSKRRRRLEQALLAIKDSGNTTMIESLTAAIEGREPNLKLPDLPKGIGKF